MLAHPDANRIQRLSVWVVSRLHPQLVREPERVIFAAAIALTGTATLFAANETGAGSIATLLPLWLVVEWALSLVLGGGFQLIGMFTAKRWIERLGLSLTAVGSLVNAICLVAVQQTPRAVIIALVYVAISLAALIRLMVSSAISATVPRAK